jgi:hypothetical protein
MGVFTNDILWIILTGVLGWTITTLLNRIKAIKAEAEEHRVDQKRLDDLFRRMMFTIAENEIIQIHDEVMKNGVITKYQMRTALSLYKTCKDLGANGFLDVHMESMTRRDYIRRDYWDEVKDKS